MKHSIITVLIALSVIAVISRDRYFPRMTEITLAEPVFIIGLDRHNDDAQVSIVYEKIEAADEGGGDMNQKYTDFAISSSPAGALEVLKKRFPREMAVSTAEYFLIGEEAAREDFNSYTDFLAKNNNLRLTASVFIVRGEALDAGEILTETKTLDILRNYGEYSGIGAISSKLMFYELLSLQASLNSFAVPALVIKENQDGEKIVVPSGYAVIKNGALAGFLEAGAARGYNIIRNKSVYSIVELTKINSAIRLENAKCKISFNWDGNALTGIVIDVTLFTDGAYNKEACRVIFGELQKVINASKKYSCDFLGFGEFLRMRHPVRWERIKDNWEEIYSQIPVKINVM